MYDLPKKEDALLYQSKGKAGGGGRPGTQPPLLPSLWDSGVWGEGGTRDLNPHNPRQP